MKILIADDSRAMRQIVKRTLRQAGFSGHEVVEAGDGETALATITGGGVDVVLCDWNMPGLTGIEVLQRTRATGVDVVFGMVTSEASAAMRDRALAAGAAFVITKPFTDASFTEALAPHGL